MWAKTGRRSRNGPGGNLGWRGEGGGAPNADTVRRQTLRQTDICMPHKQQGSQGSMNDMSNGSGVR